MQVEAKWNGFRDEILRIMYLYDRLASWPVPIDKETERPRTELELLELRRALNKALADACFRHKREWDLMAGIPVEPITHFADAHIVSMGSGI